MKSELLTWEGGEHEFALPLSSLEALQERSDGDGVGLIFHRLCNSTYKAGDVINTIIFGLEGGGMDKPKATRMVRNVYEESGLNCMVLVAQVILAGALNGWPGEETSGETPVETPKAS